LLPLPEALLLFALHDDKGTVVSSAFLALDHTLRGAILAELRLRGLVQTRVDDVLRLHPDAPAIPLEPLLSDALMILRGLPGEVPVADALLALERGLPDLRGAISTELARRGILGESTVERMGLPDDVTHPQADEQPERTVREAVWRGVEEEGDAISPRLGTLVGLTVAAHLEEEVFADTRAALDRADWVAERDAVLRAVRDAVERVEGW
jgi:hypothetical protein